MNLFPYSWAVTPATKEVGAAVRTKMNVGVGAGPVGEAALQQVPVGNIGAEWDARAEVGRRSEGDWWSQPTSHAPAQELANSNVVKDNDKDETRSFFSKLFGNSFSANPAFEPKQKANETSEGLTGNMRHMHDLFYAELPNPIFGTRFVLVDRLQPPTVPKSRTNTDPITPQLVRTSNSKNVVISGKYTSALSKSISSGAPQYSSSNRASSTFQSRPSVLPKPFKVEGSLDLENFFSPFRYSSTTSAPFQLDSFADYYYDYDYTDYPVSNSSGSTFDSRPEVNLITVSNTAHKSANHLGSEPMIKSAVAKDKFRAPPPIQTMKPKQLATPTTTPSVSQLTTQRPTTPLPTIPEYSKATTPKPSSRSHSSSIDLSDESQSWEHQSYEDSDSYEKED